VTIGKHNPEIRNQEQNQNIVTPGKHGLTILEYEAKNKTSWLQENTGWQP